MAKMEKIVSKEIFVDIWHLEGICSWSQLWRKQRLLRCLQPALTAKRNASRKVWLFPWIRKYKRAEFSRGRPRVFFRIGKTNLPHYLVGEKQMKCFRYPWADFGSVSEEELRQPGWEVPASRHKVAPSVKGADQESWNRVTAGSLYAGDLGASVVGRRQNWERSDNRSSRKSCRKDCVSPRATVFWEKLFTSVCFLENYIRTTDKWSRKMTRNSSHSYEIYVFPHGNSDDLT